MRELIFVLSFASMLSAQAPQLKADVYLVRLEHSNLEGNACSLVKASGDFHLEIDGGEKTRVFEGQLNPAQLRSLELALGDHTLENLSQEKIEEPLMANGRDSLEISIFRGDHWQDLQFRTYESQAPFQKSLEPLLRWLAKFEKLPHRELSEDAGKNNCLPPTRKLVLKRRDRSFSALPESSPRTPAVSRAPIALPPSGVEEPTPASILFDMFSFRRAGGGARQTSCMLMADDGQYRFEDRVPASSTKAVRIQVFLGKMSAEEISQLRQILDSPKLAEIRHHEPAGGLVVRMMGDMLRLYIRRPEGFQEIILSSNRPSSGYFYAGDAELDRARDLLKFLTEHVEGNPSASFPSSLRNDCNQLP